MINATGSQASGIAMADQEDGRQGNELGVSNADGGDFYAADGKG